MIVNKTPNAWQRFLLNHIHQATDNQKASDVVRVCLNNYTVDRAEALHFISHINKAVKSLLKEHKPDDIG